MSFILGRDFQAKISGQFQRIQLFVHKALLKFCFLCKENVMLPRNLQVSSYGILIFLMDATFSATFKFSRKSMPMKSCRQIPLVLENRHKLPWCEEWSRDIWQMIKTCRMAFSSLINHEKDKRIVFNNKIKLFWKAISDGIQTAQASGN